MQRPDRDVGPAPSEKAVAGRMNAAGIAVFYGARMVKELDLFESNHGCWLNTLSQGKHPKRT